MWRCFQRPEGGRVFPGPNFASCEGGPIPCLWIQIQSLVGKRVSFWVRVCMNSLGWPKNHPLNDGHARQQQRYALECYWKDANIQCSCRSNNISSSWTPCSVNWVERCRNYSQQDTRFVPNHGKHPCGSILLGGRSTVAFETSPKTVFSLKQTNRNIYRNIQYNWARRFQSHLR